MFVHSEINNSVRNMRTRRRGRNDEEAKKEKRKINISEGKVGGKLDVQCVRVQKRNKSPKLCFFQKHFPLFIPRKKRSFHPKQENKIKQTYNINNNNNNQSLRG